MAVFNLKRTITGSSMPVHCACLNNRSMSDISVSSQPNGWDGGELKKGTIDLELEIRNIVIGIVGFLANSLAFFVVVKTDKVTNGRKVLLLNLNMSDGLCMVQLLVYANGISELRKSEGKGCVPFTMLMSCLVLNSLVTCSMLSIVNVLAVYKPFRFVSLISWKYNGIGVLLSWLVSAGLSFWIVGNQFPAGLTCIPLVVLSEMSLIGFAVAILGTTLNVVLLNAATVVKLKASTHWVRAASAATEATDRVDRISRRQRGGAKPEYAPSLISKAVAASPGFGAGGGADQMPHQPNHDAQQTNFPQLSTAVAPSPGFGSRWSHGLLTKHKKSNKVRPVILDSGVFCQEMLNLSNSSFWVGDENRSKTTKSRNSDDDIESIILDDSTINCRAAPQSNSKQSVHQPSTSVAATKKNTVHFIIDTAFDGTEVLATRSKSMCIPTCDRSPETSESKKKTKSLINAPVSDIQSAARKTSSKTSPLKTKIKLKMSVETPSTSGADSKTLMSLEPGMRCQKSQPFIELEKSNISSTTHHILPGPPKKSLSNQTKRLTNHSSSIFGFSVSPCRPRRRSDGGEVSVRRSSAHQGGLYARRNKTCKTLILLTSYSCIILLPMPIYLMCVATGIIEDPEAMVNSSVGIFASSCVVIKASTNPLIYVLKFVDWSKLCNMVKRRFRCFQRSES